MNERQILILKHCAMSRMVPEHECVTWADHITLKKGAFLAVEVEGINTDHTHILVDFGRSASITNEHDMQFQCNGEWLLPIDSLAYVKDVPYGNGQGTMEALELLQNEITVDLLYDYTDRFIDIKGYPPHRFSVKEEALEKMLTSEDHIKALCEFSCQQAISADSVPYATSVYLSSKTIPQIIELENLIPEENV